MKAYADMYDGAITMMKSEDLNAFDLTQESDEMRDAYGRNPFGQGCLLARRLVERGVRFVEVTPRRLGHAQRQLRPHARALRRARPRALHAARATCTPAACSRKRSSSSPPSSAARRTSIRTSAATTTRKAFSGLLAGGGIAGGQIYGKTDKEGREVVEGRTEIPDFNATIAYALGLPLDQIIFSPSKRPFTVCDKGQPITSLFG